MRELLVQRHPVVILTAVIKAYLCMFGASIGLRLLAFYYDLLAGFEGSPDDDMGWGLMFASWCRRIIPTPKNKFEYGVTHILVVAFVIAVFAQKQAPVQTKIYGFWSNKERLKARGLSQKRTAWGLIGEQDENDDDSSEDEEEEVAAETKGDSKAKAAKKSAPSTATSGSKPKKKGEKLKKDDMPVPVTEPGSTPFWAANSAGIPQAVPKGGFTWTPEGLE
jgi:hypothetical protein